jgi:hypothetical protein
MHVARSGAWWPYDHDRRSPPGKAAATLERAGASWPLLLLLLLLPAFLGGARGSQPVPRTDLILYVGTRGLPLK